MKKPSITELIKLLDKPALLNWANKQGLEGIDISKEKKTWLSKGVSTHAEIAAFVKDGTPFTNEDTQKNFQKFICDKQVLGYEHDIETEYFVGRYDMKLKWDDEIVMVDFKKSDKGVMKKIYLEHKLQLVGYSMAEQCDKFAIVTTPDFSVIKFKIENRTPYEEIIKSLSNIYTQKQKIETHGII